MLRGAQESVGTLGIMVVVWLRTDPELWWAWLCVNPGAQQESLHYVVNWDYGKCSSTAPRSSTESMSLCLSLSLLPHTSSFGPMTWLRCTSFAWLPMGGCLQQLISESDAGKWITTSALRLITRHLCRPPVGVSVCVCVCVCVCICVCVQCVCVQFVWVHSLSSAILLLLMTGAPVRERGWGVLFRFNLIHTGSPGGTPETENP